MGLGHLKFGRRAAEADRHFHGTGKLADNRCDWAFSYDADAPSLGVVGEVGQSKVGGETYYREIVCQPVRRYTGANDKFVAAFSYKAVAKQQEQFSGGPAVRRNVRDVVP